VIRKSHFVNKLKELNYKFSEQLHYQEKWRQKGGTHIIHIPRKDVLDDEYVRHALRQAKVAKAEIDAFIRACRS
jgi:phage gp36-like protein